MDSSKSIARQNAALMKRATYFSVGVALIIVAVKSLSWFETDSVAVLASLVDSGLDVISSCINMIAVGYALQPPDREHRFGHGKAEDIASLGQAAFIFGSGIFVLSEAGNRLFHPKIIENEYTGVTVMAFCTVVTMLLIVFQRRVAKKTGSSVVENDAYHYFTDVITNLVVIVSLLATKFLKIKGIDALLGLGVAFFIIFGALKIAAKSFRNLMDHEMADDQRKAIRELAISHPGVKGMHELRTRVAGINSFIQFHVELDGEITLNEAHMITETLEQKIEKAFPRSEVLIHQDAVKVREQSAEGGEQKVKYLAG